MIRKAKVFGILRVRPLLAEGGISPRTPQHSHSPTHGQAVRGIAALPADVWDRRDTRTPHPHLHSVQSLPLLCARG